MPKKVILLFVAAFVLRLLLIPVAFHGDLYNNLSWGNEVAIHGTNGFYERTNWDHSAPNQPPLYILLFGVTSFLYKNINSLFFNLNSKFGVFPSSLIWFWQNNGNILLLKLPGIIADLGIGYLIYKIARHWSLDTRIAYLWLFNPLTFYNSAIWGQTDAIVNLLGLISIYFLLKKQLVPSMVYLVFSILFKPSLLIFLPIIFFVWIYQKHSLKVWVKSIAFCLVASVLICILFHPNIDLPIWLFNLYTQQILPGEIGDLSANAFNFWYLVNPEKVLDSIIYFGLPARIWGYTLTIITTVIIVLKLKRNNTKQALFYSLALVALTSFLFMTRIHERYLYPFFPVATLLVGLSSEFIIPYIVLSVTFLFNMYNLFWAPGNPFLESLLKTTQLPSILAIINLITFVFLFIWFLRTKSKVNV